MHKIEVRREMDTDQVEGYQAQDIGRHQQYQAQWQDPGLARAPNGLYAHTRASNPGFLCYRRQRERNGISIGPRVR